LLVLFIGGIVGCRLVVAILGGLFGPDESTLMLLASRVLNGQTFPLLGLHGNHGMPYGPYPTYFYALLYGLTAFDFRWSFGLFSLLLILSGLAVAESVASEGCRLWTFIFALTSPLAIWWSFCLWDNTLLILTSALVLYLGSGTTSQSPWREFVIGLLLGISLAIHLQAIPFVLGIALWRIVVARRLASVVALAVGAAMAVSPYALGLFKVRGNLALLMRSGNPGEPVGEPLALVTSLLGFWGSSSRIPLSFGSGRSAIATAAVLPRIASVLAVVLVILCAWYLVRRALRHELAFESPLTALILCALCYLPFAAITNSASTGSHFRAQAIWWFAPVAIPVAVLGLWPQAGRAMLVPLVLFNLVASSGQFGAVRQATLSRWRVVDQAAEDLCAAVSATRHEKANAVVTVRALPRIDYIHAILPNVLGAKYSECLAHIEWISSEQGIYDLRVELGADKRTFVTRRP
jgi:hypothetical protein